MILVIEEEEKNMNFVTSDIGIAAYLQLKGINLIRCRSA